MDHVATFIKNKCYSNHLILNVIFYVIDSSLNQRLFHKILTIYVIVIAIKSKTKYHVKTVILLTFLL